MTHKEQQQPCECGCHESQHIYQETDDAICLTPDCPCKAYAPAPSPAGTDAEGINKLKARVGKGYLSNLVWNIRNRYLSQPESTFTATEVQQLVEGFMSELEQPQSADADLKAALAGGRDDMCECGCSVRHHCNSPGMTYCFRCEGVCTAFRLAASQPAREWVSVEVEGNDEPDSPGWYWITCYDSGAYFVDKWEVESGGGLPSNTVAYMRCEDQPAPYGGNKQ
jgi:hypothetical protein